MSANATIEAPVLDPTLVDDAWFKPCAAALQANLEMLVGTPPVFTLEPATAAEAADAAMAIGEKAVVAGATCSGAATGEALIVFDRGLAVALAQLMQMAPPDAIGARIAAVEAEGANDAERENFAEVANFVVASLTERLRDLGAANLTLTPQSVRWLGTESAPAPAELVGEGRWVLAKGTCKAAKYEGGTVVFALGAEVAAAIAAAAKNAKPAAKPAPAAAAGQRPRTTTDRAREGAAGASSAPPASATPEAALKAHALVAGSGRFADAVSEALGADGIARLRGLSELVGALDAGAMPRFVAVEIARGAEHAIEMVGALRRHPGLASCAVLVGLEAPTRQHVLRCGTAGLMHVVPASTDPDEISRRIERAACPSRAAGV